MRFMLSVLCFSILCFSVGTIAQQRRNQRTDCPTSCVCLDTTVRCTNQHLHKIPKIPKDTKILDLRFNDIQEVPADALTGGLKDLNTIFLNENQIVKIHANAFTNLPSLQFLFLNRNRINKIGPNAFKGLNRLENLYLQSNEISEMDANLFSNLPHLQKLFLNHNKITKIPTNSFENLPAVRRIRLDNNELQCDCSILWFLKMVKSATHDLLYSAICGTPSVMHGKHLNEVNIEDFHCEMPKLMDKPHDTTITLGRSALMPCRFTNTQYVAWIKDGVTIPRHGSRVQILYDGTLLIENFTRSDAGRYKCKAVNDMGETESETIQINYQEAKLSAVAQDEHEKPKIVRPPTNLSFLLHDQILLDCVTIGLPKPHISWHFNGAPLTDMPSKVRIHDNGSLAIENASRANAGKYECRATNSHGTASATADVNVGVQNENMLMNGAFADESSLHSSDPLEMDRSSRNVAATHPQIISSIDSDKLPRIAYGPENQTIQAGSNTVLQCEADGEPTPTITWQKDGQDLSTTNRLFYTAENTELHIEDAVESDSGIYSCTAENTHGHETMVATISVRKMVGAPKLEYKPEDVEVLPGTVIEIPCKAEGKPNYQVKWQKDGRTLSQLPRYRFSPVGSLFITNITLDDAGRYECSITNDFGRASASGFIKVRNEEQLSPGERFVRIAFANATKEIDKAINQTVASLFGPREGQPRHYGELFKLLNFPDSRERELARAADVYERTLVNIRKHIEQNRKLTVNTTDYLYNDILSPEHLEVIARLSGCNAHRIIRNCSNVCYHAKYRTIDGSCNNLEHPTWGSSLTGFRRILPPMYEDKFGAPIGWTKETLYNGHPKPLARALSTSLISTNVITPDSRISHMMMQWGQFLDHDLDHALPSVSSESWDGTDCKKTCEYSAPCFPMEAPPNDPRIKNRRCIDFIRSSAVCGSGMTSLFFKTIQPREQINQLTSYIDASQVYGYKEDFSHDLRDERNDDGILREGVTFPDQKPMLPYASPADGIDCRRDFDESNIDCFVAGDIRVNEQVGLLAMHTIWFREHNRLARGLKRVNNHWSGDVVYNEARKIVGATMQHITYAHWLPNILGVKGMEMLGEYTGYNPNIDASISNEFATAALRFGHSLINPILHRYNENFEEIPQGHLPLHKAFFAPWRVVFEGGVDPLMRGLFTVPAKLKMPQQNLNMDLTEKLFNTAHAVALDLAAMNIQRSRDHGIPGYNEYRRFCNLTYAETFDDLSSEISSEAVRSKLQEMYGHPSNIDIWIGGILEDQVEDGKVGPLFRCLLVEQFRRLRDGDRFWYENPKMFKPEQLKELKKSTLGRVLCDNGDNITQVTDDVFILPGVQGGYVSCESLPEMNLVHWADCSACANTCRSNVHLQRVRRDTNRSKRDAPSFILQNIHPANDSEEYDHDNSIASDMNEERIEGLEALVERFEKSLKQVRRKLKKLEQTCSENPKPKQHGHCIDDGGVRRLNNEIWSKDECTNCECVHHQVNCTQQICPELNNCPQSNIIKEKGMCCPMCSMVQTATQTTTTPLAHA